MAINSLQETTVRAAINGASNAYFDACRSRVDAFVAQHFRYPGAWSTNKSALGWDLLRAPVNLFWAPIYLLILFFAWLAQRLGFHTLAAGLRRAPAGLDTSVQTHIADLIYRDLLRRGTGPDNQDQLHEMLVHALDELVTPQAMDQQLTRELDSVISDALSQYALARNASADISNSLLSTMLGAFAFKKFTPGGLAVGLILASWLAQKQAIENFFFGDFLGGLYYGLFPAQPGVGLSLLGVTAALACLAAFSALSGLILDPLQSWTGLHRRRLNKMINHLQQDFEASSSNTFFPREQYVARVMDLLDAAKSQVL